MHGTIDIFYRSIVFMHIISMLHNNLRFHIPSESDIRHDEVHQIDAKEECR